MTPPPPDWRAPMPLDGAVALPAPLYTDPAAWATERDAVFRRSWQLVAHASQVADAGDHVVADVAGLPVVVVRGTDGVLRAFHNVCRHRAGPLALCDGKGAKALRCKYHGWTYGLDGQLRAATEMGDVADFDVATVRLPEVRVGTWHGLVLVAAGDAPPLADVLGPIDARLRGRRLDDYVFRHRASYDVRCNWKAYVDNYLEGYHLPHVHPGLNRLLDYRSYDTVLDRWHSLQWSPLEGDSNFYGDGEALYYWVWPNTMLNILPGRLQTNRVVPVAIDRCRIDFDYFYAPAADAGDDARRAQDLSFSDEVQHEDVAICEAVQKGLESGSYVAGRLNPKRESGVHHFHELVREAFRGAA